MAATVLLLTVLSVTSAMAQRYLTPGTSGPQVVEAVVDQVRSSCVLPQDNLLLRRLAYVESRDGTDPDTYRSGFDGGIWQVTKAMYDLTKSSGQVVEARRAISEHLLIDWSATRWADLRKPLFSGLAAALFIVHSVHGGPSPVGVAAQQQFWNRVYHQGHDGSAGGHDTQYTDMVNLMEKGCHAGQPLLDLLFVLDTSSSISDTDFQDSKAFIVNTTSQLDLLHHNTRVAVVTYSSGAQVRISWGQQQGSQEELRLAVEGLSYQGGGTETDDALDLARVTFVGQARADALKVLVLITDGESHDPIDTAHAAARLTAAVPGILVLAVGVGNEVNEDELQTIATAPSCKHTFRVDTYDQIDALREEILRITCRAPVILHPGDTVTCNENTCPPYMAEQPPGKKIMLQVSTTCNGTQVLYGSASTPYPSHSSATTTLTLSGLGGGGGGGGNGGVMYLPRNTDSNTTTYYNVALAPSSRERCLVSIHSLIDVIRVICSEGGQQRECTHTDIINYHRDTGINLC
ncbi:uncharacterized protein LOC143289864 [Babylonia areolata]|uniref:uncharacterized protein LOC143289864 n=1 Tax=Babylonia areolata TaxID=304850 RepID=UPI003FD31064